MARVRYCYKCSSYHAEGTPQFAACEREGGLSGSTVHDLEHGDKQDAIKRARQLRRGR